jgi:serine/threonine-protein kinase
MYGVGLAISGAFVAGGMLRGALFGSAVAELFSPSRSFHLAATAVVLALWALLSLRRLSAAALDVADAGGVLMLLLLLACNAGLFELRTVSVFDLALGTGMPLVLRSILLPSTGARTLAIGVAGSVNALLVFFLSAFHPDWPVQQTQEAGWGLSSQLISLSLWLASLIGTATLASRTIYHLERDVRVARQFGQYVLGDKLGEGGMGVVYRATHAMLRRDAALKLLLPERIDPVALARFEREVMETARLRHPNTIAVFDYGRTPEGQFYYAMEYLDGVTLDQLVKHEGPLPPGRVIRLLAQVCGSLDEAHSIGLVHRDIKPQNIMVTGHTGAFDLVKVLDFGLVKNLAHAARGDGPRHHDEPASGTPLYMAPEAIVSPDKVDARTDLYAVAAVGYFMLTGKTVFDGTTVAETCAAHLYSTPVRPSERLGRKVPAELEGVLLRGLSKAPEDRPASAASFRSALLACEVPAWTDDDARAWWQAHSTRLSRSRPRSIELGRAPTVSVVFERRG